MTDFNERVAHHRAVQATLYHNVMMGTQEPPRCYSCLNPATRVTTTITPAGYHAWQCDVHGGPPDPLWGSDPGWQNEYETIDNARARYTPPEHR